MSSVTSTARFAAIKEGSIVAGRYEITGKLGNGGMGTVYKVVDRELDNQEVALKLLHPHLAENEQCFKRFRNEVLVARTLSHPNIVRIHDIGRDQSGFSYISMEFVDGVSLRDMVSYEDENGVTHTNPLKYHDVLGILLQVLAGVAYAHDRGVIHRDIKPANVLISAVNEVKLVDFGTARITGMDNSLTQAGQMIGTPDYMSPEQIKGESLDKSCDIYALGVMSFELMCGWKPFTADSAVAVAYKHIDEAVPDLTSTLGVIPDWYKGFVNKAMAKKREDRFESVLEMISAIAEHSADLVEYTSFFKGAGVMPFGAPGVSSALATGFHGVQAPHTVAAAPSAPSRHELGAKSSGFALGGSHVNSTVYDPSQMPVDELRFELGVERNVQEEAWGYGEESSAYDSSTSLPTAASVVPAKSNLWLKIVAVFAVAVLLPILATVIAVKSGVDMPQKLAKFFKPQAVETSVTSDTRQTAEQEEYAARELGLLPLEAKTTQEPFPGVLENSDLDFLDGEEVSGSKQASGVEKPEVGAPEGSSPNVGGKAVSSPVKEREAEAQVTPVQPETTQPPLVEQTIDLAAIAKTDQNNSAKAGTNSSDGVVDGQKQPVEQTTVSAETVETPQGQKKQEKAIQPVDKEEPKPTVPEKEEDEGIARVWVKPVVTPASQKSVRLMFKGSSGGLNGKIFDVTELPQVSWIAELGGLSASEQSSGNLKSIVRLIIYSGDGSRQIAAISPEQVSAGSGDIVELQGDLRAVSTLAPGAGKYRVALEYRDRVISKTFIELTSSAATSVVAKLPVEPVAVAKQTDNQLGSHRELDSPSLPSSSLDTHNVGVVRSEISSGIARQNTDRTAVFNRSTLDVPIDQLKSQPEIPQQPVEIPGERYVGSIGAGKDGKDVRLVLDLRYSGNQILGYGDIEGYQRFNASGNFTPRGVEVILRNQDYKMLLSGSKREKGFKGFFQLPAKSLRGRWEAWQ